MLKCLCKFILGCVVVLGVIKLVCDFFDFTIKIDIAKKDSGKCCGGNDDCDCD